MRTEELVPGMAYMKVERWFSDSLMIYISSFKSAYDGRNFYTFYNKETSTKTYYNAAEINVYMMKLNDYVKKIN